MVSRFVLDCSVTVAWCFSDEAKEATQAIRRSLASDHEALVPAHWSLEVTNTLLTAERRGRVSRVTADRFVALLARLPITRDLEAEGRAMTGVRDLARETALTAYDAAYLDLARRNGIPLATLDGPLRSAAEQLGVALL